MSNWDFLNAHRVTAGLFHSSAQDGFNGAFDFAIPGEARRVFCIASDGLGWQHVSVSFGKNPSIPSWSVMCAVKELFWDDEDYVIQFHPAKSRYVCNHPGVLHLWRCTDGREQPVPPDELVGIKRLGELDTGGKKMAATLEWLVANAPPTGSGTTAQTADKLASDPVSPGHTIPARSDSGSKQTEAQP